MINFTNWRARAPTQVWPPTAVQDLYGYLPVTVPSISSAACLIAFSLWDYAHHRALTLWLCAMLLVQLLRTVLLFAFRHSSQADQALPHWTWLWIFTASCTGALLGFANTYFFAPIPVVGLLLLHRLLPSSSMCRYRSSPWLFSLRLSATGAKESLHSR